MCNGVSTTVDPFWDISLDLPTVSPANPLANGISLQVSLLTSILSKYSLKVECTNIICLWMDMNSNLPVSALLWSRMSDIRYQIWYSAEKMPIYGLIIFSIKAFWQIPDIQKCQIFAPSQLWMFNYIVTESKFCKYNIFYLYMIPQPKALRLYVIWTILTITYCSM